MLGHSSIISEILEYRKTELQQGRTPTEIKLTDDQCRRLKNWCDSTKNVWIKPDGSRVVDEPLQFSDGIIFGMRFKCPNESSSPTAADRQRGAERKHGN